MAWRLHHRVRMLDHALDANDRSRSFGLATINFVQEVVKVCIPALMATGLLYGFATKWGFFSHGWVTAKWVLTIALVVSTALVPIHPLCLSGIVAGMIALFALSIFKPHKKAQKAPQRA